MGEGAGEMNGATGRKEPECVRQVISSGPFQGLLPGRLLEPGSLEILSLNVQRKIKSAELRAVKV